MALTPSIAVGGVWELLGLPLGWLMGAALVTGAFAMMNIDVKVPSALYSISLTVLGTSVGLAISPDVAAALIAWAPIMCAVAAVGVIVAILLSPVLARCGGMARSTAYFALLPGGVIEMAHIGERYGADRTIVAALHAVRVGLIVGLLPLALIALGETTPIVSDATPLLGWWQIPASAGAGMAGGWFASRMGLPAAWLLGALILVGALSSIGLFAGRLPEPLLAAVQVLVGMALGARFQRDRLSAMPRAIATGIPVILLIMAVMALLAVAASVILPIAVPTLILSFSIGGMAEMVLTSKALGQNAALVAAFQAVRGILVNATAGAVWRFLASFPNHSDHRKG